MAITAASGDSTLEAETPLLDDVVQRYVSFNGLPANRSKSGCWKSACFIISTEAAERFAYIGINSNLISYLTGPLGQSTAAAAATVNAWYGTAMLLPLLGAFIADSFVGRYRTIIIASLIYVLGLGCLSLSAVLHSSNPDLSPPMLELVVFFSSLYLIAIGQGGHKPCLQAFGADQFDEEDETECEAKSSFFNWWNFWMSGGMIVALLALPYIQENHSWGLGFGIPCFVMCFALLIFLLGSRTYRFHVKNDEGNPFVRIGLVFVKAARNWNGSGTQVESPQSEPRGGNKFKFLNKALVASNGSYEEGSICSVRDVEDAKGIMQLVPIWSACLGSGIVAAQGSTLFIKQGATMDRYITRSLQIPAASLHAIFILTLIFFTAIYDLILVPIARAVTKKSTGISMLQRVGTGLFISIFTMVVAALVEKQRLATAAKYELVDKPTETIPMSVWWLTPQYMLLGISYVFTMVGLQEFFYDQIPGELKSIGIAFYLSVLGMGSFLSSILVSVVEKATGGDGRDSWFSNNLNRAHIDYFYWLLAILSVVAMAAYAYNAKSYIYSKKGSV